MQFENSFSVDAPIDKVWAYLLDVQAVAPCLPGAELTEIISDTEYRGSVKIKLGAMQVNYKGTVVLTEIDEAAHRMIMTATGSEIRGTGGASGTVTSTLADVGPDKTTVQLLSEVNVTGRVAQFGRNIMQDVSNKLIRDFAQCLEANLTADPAAHSEHPEPAVTVPMATTDHSPDPSLHVSTSASAAPVPDGFGTTRAAEAATPMDADSLRQSEPSESRSAAPPTPPAPASRTPPMGMPAYEAAELKLWPLVRDITRSRVASGLRAVARILDPDK